MKLTEEQTQPNPYEDADYDQHLRKTESNQTRRDKYIMAADWDMEHEKTPFANPTVLYKGELKVLSGGKVTFYDTTGGTVIFTYDPASGSITFGGPITIDQTITYGTLDNPTLQGTTTISGQMTGGTLGTLTVVTLNNGTYANPTITSPTITSPSISNPSLGTPTINGGTANNITLGTPTIGGGTITPNLYKFGTSSGSTGTAVYLKTYVGTTSTFGTLIFNGGIITSIT
jgi:hypothetical protein